MTERSVVHATFVIERVYDATPARVFNAFIDPAAKRRWFVEGENWTIESYDMDVQEGGREGGAFRFKDGPRVRNETRYCDIVPDSRIVSAYEMYVADKRISASLATVEIFPEGKGAKLIYTEQAAFFDGSDNGAQREQGCRQLFEALDRELKRQAVEA